MLFSCEGFQSHGGTKIVTIVVSMLFICNNYWIVGGYHHEHKVVVSILFICFIHDDWIVGGYTSMTKRKLDDGGRLPESQLSAMLM